MDKEDVREIAWIAWHGAANAFRMYTTFTNYWNAAKGQFERFTRTEPADSICQCDSRIGETKLWCCNQCGKRCEEFHPGEFTKSELQEPTGWVSIKECLPDVANSAQFNAGTYLQSNEIIVATKEGRVFVTVYSNLGFGNLNSRTDEVTHWRPLPSPPRRMTTNEPQK